jgi:hypothetical protein
MRKREIARKRREKEGEFSTHESTMTLYMPKNRSWELFRIFHV